MLCVALPMTARGECGTNTTVAYYVKFSGTPSFIYRLIPGMCASAAAGDNNVEVKAGYHDASGAHKTGFPQGSIMHQTKKNDEEWSVATEKSFVKDYSGLEVTGWAPGIATPNGGYATAYYTFPSSANEPWEEYNVVFKYSFKTDNIEVICDGHTCTHHNDLNLQNLNSHARNVQLWRVMGTPLATNKIVGTRYCVPVSEGSVTKHIVELKSDLTWQPLPNGTLPNSRRF